MSGTPTDAQRASDQSAPILGPEVGGSEPSSGLAGRTVRRARRLAAANGSASGLLIFALLAAAAVWAGVGGPYMNLIGQACVIFAIASVGQSILVGGAGQVALSGGAFMAIGAFTAGILVNQGVDSFPVVLLCSTIVGWIVGIISGLPGLRFKGLYLLLSSLALQFIVTALTREFQAEYHPAGMVLPFVTIGPLDLSVGPALYWTLMVILLLVYVATALVERTGVGLAWRALKESEVAAAMSGIDVVRWKLYAFAASGAVTALAGCLFAYWVGRADYEAYGLPLTITLVTMVFVGGISSRVGAILGAVVITVLPYFLQNQVTPWIVGAGVDVAWYIDNVSIVNAGLFSLIFLLVILFEPEGIYGALRKLEGRIRARRASAPRNKETTS
ncbi:MAG: branched-chain amino acid ABC transporter permease [Aeromicrobium sp.]